MRVVIDNGGTDWLTPAATLLAVVVGGLVTGAVQWWHARRVRLGDGRAAARVIQGDLAVAAWRLNAMMDEQVWFAFYRFTLAGWDERQGVLALALSADDWQAVSQSAIELRALDDGMQRAVAPGGPHEGLHVLPWEGEERLAGLRASLSNATTAYNALAPLAGTDAVAGLLHDGAAPSVTSDGPGTQGQP